MILSPTACIQVRHDTAYTCVCNASPMQDTPSPSSAYPALQLHSYPTDKSVHTWARPSVTTPTFMYIPRVQFVSPDAGVAETGGLIRDKTTTLLFYKGFLCLLFRAIARHFKRGVCFLVQTIGGWLGGHHLDKWSHLALYRTASEWTTNYD